jgi:signal transduction histidine kinase
VPPTAAPTGERQTSYRTKRGQPLRALLIEDDPDDAELVLRELRRGGYEPTSLRVQTAADLTSAVTHDSWDVIISDYSMPAFSGPDAFSIVRNLNIDVPFIIVSGTVGEEVAVESMRAGVHDFLLKGALHRLVAAVERERREALMRAERRKMQEHLLIADRMASVGLLAAGVAHEINNPLSVVAANLQIIREDFDRAATALEVSPNPDLPRPIATLLTTLREALPDAREAADRVRLIVQDLRVFSHPDESKRTPTDVHKVIESSIRMARNEVRHRAKLVCEFGDVPLVEGNEARLGQVFLNLIVNAAHAMPEGSPDRNRITITTRTIAKMVAVDVNDTGSGIPADVLPRIFDVFFTTKPVGVGTGLGLSICHRIMTALGGRIEVTSEVGQGTSVRVLLRRAGAHNTQEVPALHTDPAPSWKPSGNLLIIEAEGAMGRTLPRVLSHHRVRTVSSAREALALIRDGHTVDLILCDLMMPDMTGMDLHDVLAASHPQLVPRIVFMSGGAFTPRARDFLNTTSNRHIDKPIDAASLRRLVDEMMRTPSN